MKTSGFQLAIRRPALLLMANQTYAALAPRPSHAKGVLLAFEGIGDNVAIQDFCNGGAAGNGVIGPDYDVTFAGSALSLVDADDGGGGNFANEPSSKSIMFWLNDVDTHMNFAPGFSQFSLYYSTEAPGVSCRSGLAQMERDLKWLLSSILALTVMAAVAIPPGTSTVGPRLPLRCLE
ncbi:MAG: hypothetical protein ACK5N0_02350 [Synechococcaceae cyanobacterium]